MSSQKHTKWRRLAIFSGLLLAVLAVVALVGARIWYDRSLRPVSGDDTVVTVEIPIGSVLPDIATILDDKNLIRSKLAFTSYVKSREYSDLLRAGVYDLRQNMSVQEIVSLLVHGVEAKDLITIPPGLRLDQLKQRLISEGGFSEREVESALSSEHYTNHPALVAKPRNATLEGYIYPESFQITASTTATEVIAQSLDEMAKRLTPERLAAFTRQGLTSHEAIILASVVEREVHQPRDRRIVAQIFLKRLREGMPLGADATYVYAAEITGQHPHPDLDSPYNTRRYEGLPPGPISNVGDSSLEAVANPSDTDYLYFVSGDDGKNYFARTFEEHESNIAKYCQQNCGN